MQSVAAAFAATTTGIGTRSQAAESSLPAAFGGKFAICNELFGDWPFDRAFGLAAPVLLGVVRVPEGLLGQEALEEAEREALLYAMGVDISKCIGCARCAVACGPNMPSGSHGCGWTCCSKPTGGRSNCAANSGGWNGNDY